MNAPLGLTLIGSDSTFARCAQPPEKPDGLPDSCLTEFRQNGLDVQMRFSPSLLAEWERMMEGARALVRRLAR